MLGQWIELEELNLCRNSIDIHCCRYLAWCQLPELRFLLLSKDLYNLAYTQEVQAAHRYLSLLAAQIHYY